MIAFFALDRREFRSGSKERVLDLACLAKRCCVRTVAQAGMPVLLEARSCGTGVTEVHGCCLISRWCGVVVTCGRRRSWRLRLAMLLATLLMLLGVKFGLRLALCWAALVMLLITTMLMTLMTTRWMMLTATRCFRQLRLPLVEVPGLLLSRRN